MGGGARRGTGGSGALKGGSSYSVWKGRDGGYMGPDSLTWRHGNSCSTLQATPVPAWRETRGGAETKKQRGRKLPQKKCAIYGMWLDDLLCDFICKSERLSHIQGDKHHR